MQIERLVLVGSILVDILMYVERLPERGGDCLAHHTLVTAGGGFNVLSAAARLGLPVCYAGRVGDGPMGSQVLADLVAAEIPLVLPRVRGEDTGFDVGLVEADTERTFVTAPGTESRLTLTDLQAIPLKARDAVYVSGYDLCYPDSGAALEAWLPELEALYTLVLDPGPLVASIPASRLRRVLARTNILSLNERELALLTGSTVVADSILALVPLLATGGYVVARVGAQGCWLAGADLSPVRIQPRPAQAVDSTGAGDAHIAALLARLAMGDDIQAAARVANVAASLSTERPGPATGPTWQELQAAL